MTARWGQGWGLEEQSYQVGDLDVDHLRGTLGHGHVVWESMELTDITWQEHLSSGCVWRRGRALV